jgi:hypothetical protein
MGHVKDPTIRIPFPGAMPVPFEAPTPSHRRPRGRPHRTVVLLGGAGQEKEVHLAQQHPPSPMRQATDLAPEFAQDARVLNRISGHTDSATRERIYQDP